MLTDHDPQDHDQAVAEGEPTVLVADLLEALDTDDDVRRCYHCGCDDDHACLTPGDDGRLVPCAWVGNDECSACVRAIVDAAVSPVYL